MMMGMGPWKCFGGMMWVFPFLFLGVLGIAAIVVIRRFGGVQQALDALLQRAQPSAGSGPDRIESSAESPLEILERRFARGEITREEFEEMRDALRG